MPVDSKDVWIDDGNILRDYESMTNGKILEGQGHWTTISKQWKENQQPWYRNLKTLLFILNEAISNRSPTNKCLVSSIIFYKWSTYFQERRMRKLKMQQKYIQMGSIQVANNPLLVFRTETDATLIDYKWITTW